MLNTFFQCCCKHRALPTKECASTLFSWNPLSLKSNSLQDTFVNGCVPSSKNYSDHARSRKTSVHANDNENADLLQDNSFRTSWRSMNNVDTVKSLLHHSTAREEKNTDQVQKPSSLLSELRVICSGLGYPSSITLDVLEVINRKKQHVKIRSNKLQQYSYFFNAPENMWQHNSMFGHRRLFDGNCFFFTRLQWGGTLSGLSSLLHKMILNDASVENIYIYGPPGIEKFIRVFVQQFFSRAAHDRVIPYLIINEISPGHSEFDDGILHIDMHTVKHNGIPSCFYVITLPSYIPDHDDGSSGYLQKNVLTDTAEIQTLSTTEIHVENHEPISNRKVAIIDCPTIMHVDCLNEKDYFEHIDVFVHLSSQNILSSSKYQSWMNKLCKNSHHVILNDNELNSTISRAAIIRSALNLAAPPFFPLHNRENILLGHTPESFDDQFIVNRKDSVSGRFLLHTRTDDDALQSLQQPKKDMVKISKHAAEHMLATETLPPVAEEPVGDNLSAFPRLTVLGSGGGNQGSLRCNPAFLLQADEQTNVLLDCGEGTFTQMCNHFGHDKDRLDNILSNITLIFLSHRHSDHFLGVDQMLRGIISAKYNDSKPIYVLVPTYRDWKFLVQYFKSVDQRFYSCVKVLRSDIISGDVTDIKSSTISQLVSDFTKKFQSTKILPVKVNHGILNYGAVVKAKHWKVVYSSDTLPMCQNLIAAGKNADLLIHDCLYVDELFKQQADFNLHSTKNGALKTAAAMKAKNTLLTHFTPAEGVIPLHKSDLYDAKYKGNVMYALDHMEFPLDQASLFPAYHDRLSHMFEKHISRKEKGRAKREAALLKKQNRFSKSFKALKDFL